MGAYGFFRDLFRPLIVLRFEQGLVELRGRRVWVFAWWDVSYFEAEMDFEGDNLGHIQRSDGRRMSLNQMGTNSWSKLMGLARERVWQHRFPIALGQYNSGEVVKFGQLGVSKTGLVKKGHQLKWEDIARIRIEKRLLTVRQHGSIFHWYSRSIYKIPDFLILRHFLELNVVIQVEC